MRESTKDNYQIIWRAFNKFLVKLDKQLNKHSWEERAAIFATYLVDQGMQSSMLKSYISAIKFMLKLAGHEWNEGKIILTSLTRSCHMQNDTIYTRLPIKRALLEMILFELERVFKGQFYLECLFKALYSLAYQTRP